MTKDIDILKLKSEKRRLESDLQILNKTASTTRLQSKFPRSITKSKEQIQDEINKIDEQIKNHTEQRIKTKTLSTQTNTTTSVTFSAPLTSAFVRHNTFIVDNNKHVSNKADTEKLPNLNITPHATGTIPKMSLFKTPPTHITKNRDEDPNFDQATQQQQHILTEEQNTKETNPTIPAAQANIIAENLEKTFEMNKSLSHDNDQLRRRMAAMTETQEEDTRRTLHEIALQDCALKEKDNEIEKLRKAIADSEILLKTKPTHLPPISEYDNLASNYYSLTKPKINKPTTSSLRQDNTTQQINTALPKQPVGQSLTQKDIPFTPLYRDNERIHIDSHYRNHFDYLNLPTLNQSTPSHQLPSSNIPLQSPLLPHKSTIHPPTISISTKSSEQQAPIYKQFNPQPQTIPSSHYNQFVTQSQTSSAPNYSSNLHTDQYIPDNQAIHTAPLPGATYLSKYAQYLTSQSQTAFTPQSPFTQRKATHTIPSYDLNQTTNPQHSSQYIPQPHTTFQQEYPQANQNFEQNVHTQISNLNELNEQQLARLAELITQQQQRQNNLPTNIRNYEKTTRNTPREKARDSYVRRLRLLPIFNAESYKQLHEFLEIAETLYYAYTNESEKTEFMDTINLQLRGEAKNIIGNVYDRNFEEIKHTLLRHFAYLNNKNIVSSQLENLRQETNETISAYAERTRKLLREKNMNYSHLTEEQRQEHNRLARKHFSHGIANQKLRDRLLIRGSNNLEDAIAYVIEAESDLLHTITNNELFCKYCKNSGHREINCRKKTNSQNGMNQFLNAIYGFNPNNSNTYNQNTNKYQNQNYREDNYNRSNNSNWRSNNNENNRNTSSNGNWRNNSNNYNRNSNDNRSNQYRSNENTNTRTNSNNYKDTRGNQQPTHNNNQYNKRQQSNIHQQYDLNEPDQDEQNNESSNDSSTEEYSEN